MKILIVSWYFPPSSTMGAMRVGKFAEFLIARGHEVHVITPQDVPYPQTLDMDLPPGTARLTPWIDINKFQNAVAGFVKRLVGQNGHKSRNDKPSQESGSPAPSPDAGGWFGRCARRLSDFYVRSVNFPDRSIGWLPYAVAEGRQCLRQWPADIIFASGPPFTTLLAGHRLSKRARLPWIIEFRDRWINDAYGPLQGWQLTLGSRIERRMVESAAALVTVSEPWAEDYRATYPTPVTVVYNGFDPRDYGDAPGLGSIDTKGLRIVYTGGIYPGRRDPSPLFEALHLLGDEAENISVEFYGTRDSLVYPLAEKFKVRHLVTVHPRITNRESIRAQQNADILLLLQWNDPSEQGNVPGKLFEYLAARRPILGLGLDGGVPATIIHERKAGLYLNDPQAIMGQLKSWLAIKKKEGGIPPLPEQCREGFSREEQFRKLERLLLDTVATGS